MKTGNAENATNCVRITSSLYLVRTQAGFRKAVRQYNDGENPRKGQLTGYPTSYPCLVTFSIWQDYYIAANCVHVNRVLGAIRVNEEAFQKTRSARG